MRDAIADFWGWWKKARPRVEHAIEARDLEGVDDELTKAVQAIDPGLRWELGPGDDGRNGLALIWDGSLERRRLTEAWRERAPAKDKSWTYFAARPAGNAWKDLVIELGPHRLELGKFVCSFEIDKTTERVHTKLFHPGLSKAPENVRVTITFVMLDRAFGEDGVERWLGEIEIATSKPKGARPVTDLVKAVKQLAKKATGEQFALYEGERDGAAIFIMKNEALKPIDHLHCDTELSVRLAIEDATDAGLPTKKESVALDKIENDLIRSLGDDAAFHGRETVAETRTLFFFASPAALKKVERWQKKAKRDVRVATRPDPAWDGLERWS